MASIADKILEDGLKKQIEIHGRDFVCNEKTIRGLLRDESAEGIEYIDNDMPRAKSVIWFPLSATSLNEPFRVGGFLVSGKMRYEIKKVEQPDGAPRHWTIVCDNDYHD
jgi:hypothetical protein